MEEYLKSDDFKIKSKETSINKYGVNSPNKSESVKYKKVLSMINKYGYISNSMTNESKNKLKSTNIDRYGVEYPMQVCEFAEKQQRNAKKIKYYNYKLFYQGSYEKDFLEYLDNLDILDNVSRGMPIKYKFDGKNKIHYPDFYLEKYNLIVEIKSSYYYNKYLDKNISKMNKCIELGYNYIFIINKNYTILNYIIEKQNPL